MKKNQKVFHRIKNTLVATFVFGTANVIAAPSMITFEYDGSGNLTSMTDESGNPYAQWDYDADGRGVLSTHAGSADRADLTYNDDGTVAVTNALNKNTIYSFDVINGVRKIVNVEGEPSAHCSGANKDYEYYSDGLTRLKTDWEGNTTTYFYDHVRSIETSRTEASGTPEARTIETDWHSRHRLVTEIREYAGEDNSAPHVRTTTMAYYGDLTGEEQWDGLLKSRTVTDPMRGTSQTWSYSYHPAGTHGSGQVASINGPRTDVSDVTTYRYFANGNLKEMENALGHITQYLQYDAAGRLLLSEDPNGVQTQFTYHPRGWLSSTTVAFGTADARTTQYDYEPTGKLKRITLPSGSYLDYSYDAAQRLTAITNNFGEQIRFELNSMGGITKEEKLDANGSVRYQQRKTFDELNRVRQSITSDNHVTEYQYNKNNALELTTDANLNPSRNVMDAIERVEEQIDASGNSTEYNYDHFGRVSDVTDARGNKTQYEFDAHGNLLSLNSPATGVTTYAYDYAGNRLSETDARGLTVSYGYDALNRVQTISYPDASENITYQYDDTSSGNNGVGRLTSILDASGSTYYSYDNHGRVTSVFTGIGAVLLTTGYQYNADGNVERIIYPSGNQAAYSYDAIGQIDNVYWVEGGSAQVLATDIEYTPYGPMTNAILGNGYVRSHEYDQNYQLISRADRNTSPLVQVDYRYEPVGNIEWINDLLNASNDQSFVYDNLYRLDVANGAWGAQDYAYDSVHNRTELNNSGTVKNYRISPGNKLSMVMEGWNVNQIGYDPGGRITMHSEPYRRYFYNDAGRLESIAEAGTTLGQYTYNAMGQRVAKTTASETRYFLYGQSGELLAEFSDSGNVIAEYVYLNGQVLAMNRPNPATSLYFFHNSHLGTPEKVTDMSGAVRWDATFDPYGNLLSQNVNDIEQNIRFPGQYFDVESGLHYNYFRYYDPGLGRYISSDPIGLEAGVNTYAYVLGNPVNGIDPNGLRCVYINGIGCVPGPVIQYEFDLASTLLEGVGRSYACTAACVVQDYTLGFLQGLPTEKGIEFLEKNEFSPKISSRAGAAAAVGKLSGFLGWPVTIGSCAEKCQAKVCDELRDEYKIK